MFSLINSLCARLSPRNFADEVERKLALFGVAGNFDNEFVEAHGKILLQASAALRRRAGNGEDVRRFHWQEPHGALKIVTGMRGDDRLMVDIKVR